MTQVRWDRIQDRTFEYGVDRGVLYVDGKPGVAWSGLLRVDQRTVGGELAPIYMDGELVRLDRAKEHYTGAISAVMYPEEFEACEGIEESSGFLFDSQRRASFGLSYRTLVGNPLSERIAYKLHLLYNASVTPTERNHGSAGQTLNPTGFSWNISAVPLQFPDRRATAHISLDSRRVDRTVLDMLEQMLYGTDTTDPRMPTSEELAYLQTLQGFRVELVGGKPMLTPGYPAEFIGDPNTGVYKQTEHSPLVDLTPAGKPGIYGLEI